MKIVREVNGVSMEFELTDQELFSAYEEQENIWDRNYIENEFDDDERFEDMTLEAREEAFDDIAWRFRKIVDRMEYRNDWEAACMAVDEYFKEREVSLDGRLADAQERVTTLGDSGQREAEREMG